MHEQSVTNQSSSMIPALVNLRERDSNDTATRFWFESTESIFENLRDSESFHGLTVVHVHVRFGPVIVIHAFVVLSVQSCHFCRVWSRLYSGDENK